MTIWFNLETMGLMNQKYGKTLTFQEMFNEMTFLKMRNNCHRQLSVEHQYRPEDIKLCGQHILTNKDTINATMKLHYCGSNYWTDDTVMVMGNIYSVKPYQSCFTST